MNKTKPEYWYNWNFTSEDFPNPDEIWEILKETEGKELWQISKQYLPWTISDDRFENHETLDRFIRESGDLEMMRKYKVKKSSENDNE